MLFTRYKHRAGRECLLIHFFWDNEGNGRLEWTPTDIWKTFNLGIRSWHCSRVATGVILWERRVGIETNGLLGRESLSDGGRGSTWMKGEDVSSYEIARNCWRLRSAVANTIAWHAIDPEFNPRRSHFFLIFYCERNKNEYDWNEWIVNKQCLKDTMNEFKKQRTRN